MNSTDDFADRDEQADLEQMRALFAAAALELTAPAGFAGRVMDALGRESAPAFRERLARWAGHAHLPQRLSPRTRALTYSALALTAVAVGIETRRLLRSREVRLS